MTSESITGILKRTSIAGVKYYDGEVSKGDQVTYQVVEYQKNNATEKAIAVMNSRAERVGSVSGKKALTFLPHLISGELKMIGEIIHTGKEFHVVDVKLTIPKGNSKLKQELEGEKVVFDDDDSDSNGSPGK